MLDTLLRTKLFIPSPRPNLVSRPRLTKLLNQGLEPGHKLTLISAPAGFGKTTLVSEWLANMEPVNGKTGYHAAWLSLDEGDNDPARFLNYLVAALNGLEGIAADLGQGALSMLQSPQPPPAEAVLTALINDIVAIPDMIVFVLDDYHVIQAQPVHAAVTFLLESLPPQLHLLVATREDPELPVARLRARGLLTEVRAADLRFTVSEAAEFLNQAMGLNLSVENIAALEARTEGWIAGLQLASVSIQGREDTTAFIESFTGSHHFVLDYLIEEVLDQQPASIQSFLLQTSILNRLVAPLCDALTRQENSQATLEMLEHANLFIVPLDEERRYFRYHHLFADLLRRRLSQLQLEQIPMLHRRASEWYEQNGAVSDAIEHALWGEDVERVASLLETYIDVLWQRGQHGKLRHWLVTLPAEIVSARPQLAVFRALYLFTSGQLAAAARDIQGVEQAFGATVASGAGPASPASTTALSDADLMLLRGRLAAIQAFMGTYLQGDMASIIQHANQALEFLPQQDTTMRSLVAIALGDAYSFKGDVAAAYRAYLEALEIIRSTANNYFLIVGNLKIANTKREHGQLQQTIDICAQQLRFAEQSRLSQASIVGWLLALWGEALVEMNQLEKAVELARKGVELPGLDGDIAMLGWSYLCLMRVLFSSGDMPGAEGIIRDMEQLSQRADVPPWVRDQTAAWQARLWLAQGNLTAAAQWLATRGLLNGEAAEPAPEISYFQLNEHLLLARYLIAGEQPAEAARLLERLRQAAVSGGRTSRLIEILLLQAQAFQSIGDSDRSMAVLEQGLTFAEPSGFIRIFVDEGQPMARLLTKALARGLFPDYIRHLLASFPETRLERAAATKTRALETAWTEALSEREIEVLQLIAEGLTNQEIAARLFLSAYDKGAHAQHLRQVGRQQPYASGESGQGPGDYAVQLKISLGILA